MGKKKAGTPARDNNQIRKLLLQYFYDRNQNATSPRGKKGSAVKISDVKRELKELHGLTQQEVQSNLTYLMSQGWVEEDTVEKSITAKGGTVIPSSTNFYKITAPGIDKLEGPGEFTMPKFHGVNINATGQNLITVGDGNQIKAEFNDLGQALADLHTAVTDSDSTETQKLSLVADIDTIQSQLAKPEPNRSIITSAWESVRGAAAINGCAALVGRVAALIARFVAG